MDGKTQGRNEVKESIVLICRMLKYSDIYANLSPDHVRQGKFDKSEALVMLSEVLLALVEKGSVRNIIVDMQEKIIQDSLIKCRYPRICYLFDENGKLYSSREILLAISWFIECDDTIEQIRLTAMRPVDIIQLSANKYGNMKQKKLGKQTAMEALSSIERTNYISWIVSQINLLKNQIISLEGGNAYCKAKVSSAAKIEVSDDPLMLLILRYPSLRQEYERELEKKVLLLQACNRWKQVKHVYWSWMDSVLAAAVLKETSSYELPKSCKTSPCKQPPLMSAFEGKLRMLQELLSKEKESYVCNTSKRRELLSTLQPEQKAEIDREIYLLEKLIHNTSHKVKLKLVKDGGGGNRLEKDGHILERSMPLSLEYERLSRVNKSASERLSSQRLEYKEALVGMSREFSDIVLIPPDVPKRRVPS